MNYKKRFSLLVVFIAVSLIVSIVSSYFGFNLSSIEAFVSMNRNIAGFLYTLIFIGLATFSFSISAMTSWGTVFFEGYEVVIYSVIGILGSSIIHFYISRKLGRDYARRKIEERGEKLEKFDEILEKDNFKTILILSAIFFVPPIIPNLLGGVMKINLKKYSIATFLGNIPNTIFTVYLIKGFLYGSKILISVSIAGLILTTLTALYFYKGEIREILKLSFPWIFRKI